MGGGKGQARSRIDQPAGSQQTEAGDLFAVALHHHLEGRRTEAEDLYRQVLDSRPDHVDALCNLAILLKGRGELDAAIACYRRAIAVQPDHADVLYNLGIALEAAGKRDEAEAVYRRALAIRPDTPTAANNLGNLLVDQGRLDEAETVFRQGLAARPDHVPLQRNLADMLAGMGRSREAAEGFRRAWELSRDCGYWLRAATVLPVVPASLGEIAQARQHYAEGFREAARRELKLTDPFRQVAATGFLLAYHGIDDLPLQRLAARAYAAACPALQAQAPHCLMPARRSPDGRLRIGFVSENFCAHTITRLNAGLMRHLSRRFHVSVFLTPRPMDHSRRALIRHADQAVMLPLDVAAARQHIAEQRLDILYYPDIGMSPFTYFLAFARLAPVQVVAWGHPDTTGIPNLDYFLSCDAMEPDGAEAHYTERLIRLPGPTIHYTPPSWQPRPRSHFGLPDDAHIYLCPQTLYKFHPDFDPVLTDILRRDPKGVLVLIRSRAPCLDRRLLDRLAAAGPDVAGRIRMLPQQLTSDFIALMAVSDVMLDPLHYSGGNTTLEAFAVGVPVVTWPGAFMRGRHTHGFYKLMGMDQCIARDWRDYADLAHRLGTDAAYRAQVSQCIQDTRGVLYNNMDTVHALEDVLGRLVGSL